MRTNEKKQRNGWRMTYSISKSPLPPGSWLIPNDSAMIQRNKMFANDARFPFCNTRMPSVIVYLICTAVALAFEETHTPYASGREICVQKFGNVYQRKEQEKWMLHFKSTFGIKFIKRFNEIKCSSQTMRASLSHTRTCSVIICVMFRLRCVETESWLSAYAVRIASIILHTARFLCVIYAEICVNATTVCSLRHVETKSCFLRTLYTSLPCLQRLCLIIHRNLHYCDRWVHVIQSVKAHQCLIIDNVQFPNSTEWLQCIWRKNTAGSILLQLTWQDGHFHCPSFTVADVEHSLWNTFGHKSHSMTSPGPWHFQQYQSCVWCVRNFALVSTCSFSCK